MCFCAQSLSCIRLLVTPWTVAHQASVLGDSPGKNTGILHGKKGCHALLQGIFPTQGPKPGLLHCRQILCHLSHWGSPQLCIHIFFLSIPTHSTRIGTSLLRSLFLVTAAGVAKSLQLCLTLCDPIVGSPPGSSVPGILQERILEWVAISFPIPGHYLVPKTQCSIITKSLFCLFVPCSHSCPGFLKLGI